LRKINAAEASHWKQSAERNAGQTIKAPSDQILGFDCGGRQLVYEIAFAAESDVGSQPDLMTESDLVTESDLAAESDLGTESDLRQSDLDVPLKLLEQLEAKGIPAPGPIEQRWTASSSATMSPARGEPGDVFSWIGIIMYLNPNTASSSPVSPVSGDDQNLEHPGSRCLDVLDSDSHGQVTGSVACESSSSDGVKVTDDAEIRQAFQAYKQLYRDVLDELEVSYRPHWAKSEDYPRENQPEDLVDELVKDKMFRFRIDPTNTMSNPVVDRVVARKA
jgi:hypothetical protein